MEEKNAKRKKNIIERKQHRRSNFDVYVCVILYVCKEFIRFIKSIGSTIIQVCFYFDEGFLH